MEKKANSKRPSANKELKKDVLSIVLTFAGVVGGHLLYKGANKVLKIDASSSKIKKAIPPAVILVGGGVGAFFIKKTELRLLLGGAAVSGAVHTTGVLLDKNLLAGLKGVDEGYVLEDAVSENYDMNLPELDYNLEQEEEQGSFPIAPTHESSSSDDDYEDAEII